MPVLADAIEGLKEEKVQRFLLGKLAGRTGEIIFSMDHAQNMISKDRIKVQVPKGNIQRPNVLSSDDANIDINLSRVMYNIARDAGRYPRYLLDDDVNKIEIELVAPEIPEEDMPASDP